MNKYRLKKITASIVLLAVPAILFANTLFVGVAQAVGGTTPTVPGTGQSSGTEVPKPAGITFTRLNYAVIKDSSGTYWIADAASPTSRPTLKFIKQGSASGSDYIQISNPNVGISNEWSKDLLVYSSTSSSLNGTTTTFYKSGLKANSGDYTYTYYWIDKNTIGRYAISADGVDIPAVTYTFDKASGFFLEPGSCADRIKVNGNSANITVASSNNNDKQFFGVFDNGGQPGARYLVANTKASDTCYLGTQNEGDNGGITISLAAENKNADPGKGKVGPVTPAPGSSSDVPDSCYSALPVFGWILCPIVDIADLAFTWMRNTVFNLLTVPSAAINSSNGLKSVWNVAKNLATAGLVLVAIIMVASQIFSFDFISAYTIKKVLPRLVIATIAMQLSWFIFTLLIQITNSVGVGIYQLLINAFGAQDIMDILGSLRSAGANVTAGAVTILGSVSAAVGIAVVASMFTNGGALMIVFAALSVLISIVVAILTLVVRQMLIIILLVLSPLAILAWILPGTQNLWTSWWKLFSRLLAMYPLIAVLFAGGAIAAKTVVQIGTTSGQSGSLPLIMAIILYFAPLFLVPSTFKFAGGMFTSVTNMLNKAGDKAKNAGYFGTRARAKESYQENKKAKGLQLAGRSTGPGLINRFNRTRGRISAGTAGATGNYADKLRESELKQDYQNALLEQESLIKEIGPDHALQAQARLAYAGTAVGELAQVRNNNGDVIWEARVNQRTKRAVAISAAQNKEHEALRAYEASSPGDLSAFVNTNQEAWSALDQYAPGFTRAPATARGSLTVASGAPDGARQTAISNYSEIGAVSQAEINDHILNLLNSTDEIQRRQGLGHLASIARNGKVSEADLATLAQHVSVADLSKLRTNPNARLDTTGAGSTVIIE